MTWSNETPGQSGAPPGTRTPNPRIKSPLFRSILLLCLYRNVPRRAVLCGCPHPRRAAGAGCYRGVPGHPSKHGANIKPGRSRPLRDASPLRRTSGSSCEKRVPPQPARAEDTMRNHRCLGDKRQRGKEAELSPPGAGSAATTRPSGNGMPSRVRSSGRLRRRGPLCV